MTILQLRSSIKEIADKHSIYGLECMLTEIAEAYKDHEYVDKDYMLYLFSQAIDRVSKREEVTT